jgi:hypothetical protein
MGAPAMALLVGVGKNISMVASHITRGRAAMTGASFLGGAATGVSGKTKLAGQMIDESQSAELMTVIYRGVRTIGNKYQMAFSQANDAMDALYDGRHPDTLMRKLIVVEQINNEFTCVKVLVGEPAADYFMSHPFSDEAGTRMSQSTVRRYPSQGGIDNAIRFMAYALGSVLLVKEDG